jgi:branched-subunit amino acid ABC-type transport system permease component
VAALVAVAVAAVAGGRLSVVVAVKTDITQVATAAAFSVEIAATVAGVGSFTAAAIAVVLDGKAASEFPDKCIQK